MHKSYLMEHMSYHTNERQFQCYHCGNRFQAQSALVKHMKRHTTTKDFACNNCPKAFAVKTDLKSHIRLVHEKPQVSCTMKPSPTEISEESLISNKTEENQNENSAIDETSAQQEHNQVNDENEQSLDRSNNMVENKEIGTDVTENLPGSDSSENLPSDDIKSSKIVNITNFVSNETKPKAIEDKTVPILEADVDDQTPVSTSKIPPDKAKEIIPYIPNVPKV